MAKTLDRSKPHGIVWGDDQGRAYEQDGVFFTATGDLWQPPPEAGDDLPAAPTKRKAAAAPAAEPAAAGEVDSELAAQMGQR